jgi:hypothetical protein
VPLFLPRCCPTDPGIDGNLPAFQRAAASTDIDARLVWGMAISDQRSFIARANRKLKVIPLIFPAIRRFNEWPRKLTDHCPKPERMVIWSGQAVARGRVCKLHTLSKEVSPAASLEITVNCNPARPKEIKKTNPSAS